MNILLLGFMGSGKSSVAEALSQVTSLEHVELDEIIVERSEYSSIPEIFSQEGESFFRDLESKVLVDVLKKKNVILSTGGGIVEIEHNRAAILALPEDEVTTVFLDTPFEELVERIGDPAERPLFKNRDEAQRRCIAREPYYRELSKLLLPTERNTPEELATVIAASCNVERQGKFPSVKLWSVIGNPVAHSLSPRLHNEMLAGREFFTATRVNDLRVFVEAFRKNNAFCGLAVTIPHKEAIIPLLDEVSEEVRKIGAVNTVVKKDGKCCGWNTDWCGIQEPIASRGDFSGKRVAILGAGGTARAALYALQSLGSYPTLINRSPERGMKVADEFHVPFLPLSEVSSLHGFDAVVQTTSVGMKSEEEPLFLANAFRKGMVVMDVIYTPEITCFLQEAQKAGAEIVSGRELFLAQAKAQFEIHHGCPPDSIAMKRKLQELMQ